MASEIFRDKAKFSLPGIVVTSPARTKQREKKIESQSN